MGELFGYSLGVSVFLLCGYLTYKLFLAGEKQPGLNRMALILIYIAGLVAIPLLSMEWSRSEPVTAGIVELGAITVSVAPTEESPGSMLFPRILLWGYIIGMAVVSVVTLIAVIRLALLLRRGRRTRRDGYTLITLPVCEVPFSFGRYIVVGEGEQPGDMLLIEAHEQAHLACHHWLDLILAQATCILLWYNPVVWLMRDELRQVHEYQADASVLSKGFDCYTYQMLIIKKAAGRRLQSLANSLNHSNLSKRITMMYKSQNRVVRSMRALTLVPAIVLAALAVEQPVIATTIGQAGTASLISAPAVQQPVVDSKVSEFLADDQQSDALDAQEVSLEEIAPAEESIAPAPAPAPVQQAVAEKKDEKVCVSVKEMPQFPGGDIEMLNFIKNNLKYPEDAIEAHEQGRVVVRFVISAEGKVKDAEIVRGRSESMNAEALRVVSMLPDFIPGKNDKGEPVAVYYTLPVSFKLKSDTNKPKEVTTYTGNLKVNPGNETSKYTVFVNGKQFDGNVSDIKSEDIAQITITKNDPAYPDGKMDITLKN